MLKRLTPRTRRNLTLFLIFASAIATATGVLFADRISDPYVNYYGKVMRKSEFVTQRTNAKHRWCYSVNTLSLHFYSVCFDSREELEQFIAEWHKK